MTELVRKDDPGVVAKVRQCFENGGVVVYPTETLYGIGCLAFDEKACARIAEIKRRSQSKGLIVLVKDEEMLEEHFRVPDGMRERYRRRQKPVTLILEPKSPFPKEVSGGRNTVAVRISSSPFVKKLFEVVKQPVTSTSANISGRGGAISFAEVVEDFAGTVDVIVNSGDLASSKGSAIVNPTTDPPEIVRMGDFSEDEMEEFLNG